MWTYTAAGVAFAFRLVAGYGIPDWSDDQPGGHDRAENTFEDNGER